MPAATNKADMYLRDFIMLLFCVRFDEKEKDGLIIIFIYLLDVEMRERLNGLLPTIDQHNDLIDKPDQITYCIYMSIYRQH